MKAQDLRIGNYAQDQNGNILIVCQLNKGGSMSFDVYDRSKFPLPKGWKAEPIPLTEEWLIKFGFNDDGDSDGTFYRSKEIKGVVNLESDSSDNFSKCQLTGFENSLIVQVEYVHQLQNLYFVLTGEELTLKA